MKTYIGVKIIKAEPMRSEFAEEVLDRNIESKYNEDGYLIQYPDGYKSWSPKNVFEGAYREISNGEKQLLSPDAVKA